MLFGSPISDELLGICRHAPTPATIALYASWGSGKSSLGRILETEFKNDRQIAYTHFDAPKYAEKTPLQRHFLSQVAGAFHIGDSKYSRNLYKSIRGTDFKLTIEKAKRLAGVLIGAIAALLFTVAIFRVSRRSDLKPAPLLGQRLADASRERFGRGSVCNRTHCSARTSEPEPTR